MSTITIETPAFEADVIPDDDDGAAFIRSDEPTCQVCGKEIGYLYGGRGRKPTRCEDHKRQTGNKTTGASRTRSNGDVDQAVEALDGAYSMLAFALVLFAPVAASNLSASLPGLREKNRAFLANDKELVRSINKVGKTGGRVAFFAAQAMVLVPVGALAASEIRDKLAARAEDSEQDSDAPIFAGFPSE